MRDPPGAHEFDTGKNSSQSECNHGWKDENRARCARGTRWEIEPPADRLVVTKSE